MRLDPTDSQRIVRALEIFSTYWKMHVGLAIRRVECASPNLTFFTSILLPDRDELFRAINMRFDRMLEAGAVEEVEHLLASKPDEDYPPLKAVGVLLFGRF